MSPLYKDRAYRRKRMVEDKQKRLNKTNNEDNVKNPYVREKKLNPREIEVTQNED